MKNILAIDCATSLLSVALKVEDNIKFREIEDGFKHSENLVPLIQELLTEAGITCSDLELLVCTRGPGSFTGLRIAMATLKGISMALDTPLVSIPTLDLYSSGKSDFKGIVLPIIDARKKCYYTALYRNGEKLTEDLDIDFENILNLVNGEVKILLTGIDAPILFDKLSQDSRFTMDNSYKRNYSIELIDLGLKQFENSGPDHIDQGPLYLRKSEAEIHLERKLKEEY